MNVADDNKDAKLYRVAGDFLPELLAKLPKLVRRSTDAKAPGPVRKWVLESKTGEIIQLLDAFQEWPQLLDPHLAMFVQVLADAFLSYTSTCSDYYVRPLQRDAVWSSPLPRAVSKILYVLCKVRGQKIIVRLLNNEPKHIEPLLNFVARWGRHEGFRSEDPEGIMSWQEEYILMLWLSHLMLTPFDLFSVSSAQVTARSHEFDEVSQGMPKVAVSLLAIAVERLYVPSKEREAASALVVRLTLRPDMQIHQSCGRLVTYALRALQRTSEDATITSYFYVGLLSLLFGILNTGSDDEIAPFLGKIFQVCLELATGSSAHQLEVRNSAPSRKLLIKIMRSASIHALSLASKSYGYLTADDVDIMLEETIQSLLEALGDKDTPVRMAASKNLSMIALKLDSAMSAEVVQAVLDCLDENMLLEHSGTGKVIAITDIAALQSTDYHKNLSAVDPLKWHGLMLTLGHLLFRRSPPTHQLSSVIESLILGLNFEQRSNVGSSVGVGVRDAACFGLWSLARKYSTTELHVVDSFRLGQLAPDLLPTDGHRTALQIIAVELVISASSDPSGNIRRGSSAALQELIGRHPDAINAGIPLVQTVDYNAVARHSNAVCHVAVAAADLDVVYHLGLLNALVDWRGAKAADQEARRSAAFAVGIMAKKLPKQELLLLCEGLIARVFALRSSNLGVTAEMRHGHLLMLSSIFSSSQLTENESIHTTDVLLRSGTRRDLKPDHAETLSKIASDIWKQIDQMSGNVKSRVTRDLELVLEAMSSLIGTLATFCTEYQVDQLSFDTKTSRNSEKLQRVVDIVERCVTASEKDFVADAASQATAAIFVMLDDQAKLKLVLGWTDHKLRKKIEVSSKGRIRSLGLVFALSSGSGVERELKEAILEYLKDLGHSSWPIETRVGAMASLTRIITSEDLATDLIESLVSLIIRGLTDYTVDQRGDVGSTLRLESIGAAENILTNSSAINTRPLLSRLLIQELVKLAAEKLNKVRFKAWTCLENYWKSFIEFPKLQSEFHHPADVSSTAYYLNLLELLEVDWLQRSVLVGFISSLAAGTEDIGRASSIALVMHLQSQDPKDQAQASTRLFDIVIDYLQSIPVHDDRDVIPALDFFAFCLEQGLFLPGENLASNSKDNMVWLVMQKAHSPAASIQRLESVIRVYSALCSFKGHSQKASDRLTRMLLHRYPKIRGAAADVLFFHTQAESILACDWTWTAAELKPAVVQIRKELGIATQSGEAHG